MSLAKRLKELRKVKKISQRELAKILKISSGAVGMYETGKREPDIEPGLLLYPSLPVRPTTPGSKLRP